MVEICGGRGGGGKEGGGIETTFIGPYVVMKGGRGW